MLATDPIDELTHLLDGVRNDADFASARGRIDDLFSRVRALYANTDDPDARMQLAAAMAPLSARRADFASGRVADLDTALAQMGVSQLRGLQPAIIGALDAGEDVVAVMATGAGKSLCYQAPALYRHGLTVVISPLIALMSDQLRRLTDAGVHAGMLNSHQAPEAERATMARLRAGELRVLLCAPERLDDHALTGALERNHIGLLAVDEAHCVVEWGDDFRPAYQGIGAWRARVGVAQTLALTASATPDTADQIAMRLGIGAATQLRGSVERPNIRLDVRAFAGAGQRARKLDELVGALGQADTTPAIVYAGTRRDAQTLAGELEAMGYRTGAYHAGMSADERTRTQARFMTGDIAVMCATSAFGMGVDKADVRLVVHWQTPGSMEAYYQEIGRAGRDGAPSRALLLASSGDEGRLGHLTTDAGPSEERVAQVHAAWRAGEAIPPSDEDINPERPGSLETALLLRAGALTWAPSIAGMMIVAPYEAIDGTQLADIDRWLEDAHRRRWARLDDILDFAQQNTTCRRVLLAAHFGEETQPGGPDCCDICTPRPPAPRGLGDPAGAGADRERWEALCAWRERVAGADDPAALMGVAAMRAFADTWPRERDGLERVEHLGPLLIGAHADDQLELTTGRRGGELSATERRHATRLGALRGWRREHEAPVDDAGLERIARTWPRNRDDLMGIPGMGDLPRRAARALLDLCRSGSGA